MTVYVDKTVNFPVKFSMTSTGTYGFNFDIVLVSTNIPILQSSSSNSLFTEDAILGEFYSIYYGPKS